MGNDGGSIPTRRELVKEAARNPNTSELKATQHESQTHAWTYCPLSQRPLAAPIVSDCAGILYNKDAVIEFLLPNDDPSAPGKTEYEEVLAGRIKSLRDIVEVKFEVVKDENTKEEKKICPISSKELGASTKAVYLVPCGHAFSEVAIREIQSDACVVCNEPYTKDNVITILPITKEDIAALGERIKKLKEAGLTHALKKAPGSKKRKKNAEVEAAQNGTETETNGRPLNGKTTNGNGVHHSEEIITKAKVHETNGLAPSSQVKNGAHAASNGIKNAATASLTAKVLDEQEERNKKRKLGMNENLKSLFSNSNSNVSNKNSGDFMTRGFSIPKRA